MNLYELINKIKNFFRREKTILSLAPATGQRKGEDFLSTRYLTPKEAFDENIKLGKQEIELLKKIKGVDDNIFNIIRDFIDDKTPPEDGLGQLALSADAYSHYLNISTLASAYMDAQTMTRGFLSGDIAITSEEMASLLYHLRDLKIDELESEIKGLLPSPEEFHLSVQQQQIFSSLSKEQQQIFNSLSISSRKDLLQKCINDANPLYMATMINTIGKLIEKNRDLVLSIQERKDNVIFPTIISLLDSPKRRRTNI